MEDFSPSIASNDWPGFALEKEVERVTEKVYNKEGVDVQEVAGSDDVSVMQVDGEQGMRKVSFRDKLLESTKGRDDGFVDLVQEEISLEERDVKVSLTSD